MLNWWLPGCIIMKINNWIDLKLEIRIPYSTIGPDKERLCT